MSDGGANQQPRRRNCDPLPCASVVAMLSTVPAVSTMRVNDAQADDRPHVYARCVPAAIWIIKCRKTVAMIALDVSNVMIAKNHDHTCGWRGRWELMPITSRP